MRATVDLAHQTDMSFSERATLDRYPLDETRVRLKEAGLRQTLPRMLLGWLLFHNGNRHVTAKQLHEEACCARFNISLATVYNTLNQFSRARLLRRIEINFGRAYFDTDTTQHAHFFVEGDQVLFDMQSNFLANPDPPNGFEVSGVDVVVRLRKSILHRPELGD